MVSLVFGISISLAFQVQTLLAVMKRLRGEPLHANVSSAMGTWMLGIRKVQARRKEEIANAANRHRSGGPRLQEEKDVLLLAAAIGELTTLTRHARTALWCALQMASCDVPIQCVRSAEQSVSAQQPDQKKPVVEAEAETEKKASSPPPADLPTSDPDKQQQ